MFFSGYPPTPTTPGTNQANGGGGPPAEALSAALVAAAATATATATATAVMGMQERHQNPQQMWNHNMNNQGYGHQVTNWQISILSPICHVTQVSGGHENHPTPNTLTDTFHSLILLLFIYGWYMYDV